jgi:hypothetical protein
MLDPNRDKHRECPIVGCKGWESWSWRSRQNEKGLISHIKSMARSELLRIHLLDEGYSPHADWLKDNMQLERVVTYKVRGKILKV